MEPDTAAASAENTAVHDAGTDRAAINVQIRSIGRVAGLDQAWIDGQVDASATVEAASTAAIAAMQARSAEATRVTEKTAVERVAAGTTDVARRLSLAEGRATMAEVQTPGMSVAAVRRAIVRVRRLLPDADG